jgi:hypothetical protein
MAVVLGVAESEADRVVLMAVAALHRVAPAKSGVGVQDAPPIVMVVRFGDNNVNGSRQPTKKPCYQRSRQAEAVTRDSGQHKNGKVQGHYYE